jgi:16S rRNA (cytosine967-C5)-methyltransferase
MAHTEVSAARRAAFAALLRIERGAHFEEAVRREPAMDDLVPRDAHLAWELVAGVTRRRATLDAVLSQFATHPLGRVDVRARCALRLGAYQLLYLDRVPAHAAVAESVGLAAPLGRRTAGFVNAVLRRVASDGAACLKRLVAADDERSLSIRFSCPAWLVHRWVREWGREGAESLLAAADRPPERCLRVNTLVAAAEEARDALAEEGVEARKPTSCRWSGTLPDALIYSGAPIERTRAYRDGLVSAQSRAAQLVGVLAARGAPGASRVADLCAAPGIKTAHLVALLPACSIVAVDAAQARAAELRTTLRRLRVDRAEVRAADAATLPEAFDDSFDLILLDAPCTGLGILSERPDLRWRRRPHDVERMAVLQANLARRAARLLRPGGVLLYSVCTLTPEETTGVVEPLAAAEGLVFDDLGIDCPELRHPRFGPALLTMPDRDGTSGFFIARLRRPDDRSAATHGARMRIE